MTVYEKVGFSRAALSNYVFNLFKTYEDKLNNLNVNADGRHYGYITIAAQTGIGKSAAAIRLGTEKVRENNVGPQVVYVSKKKNNLPEINQFPEDVRKYVVRVKSNEDGIRDFVQKNHSNLKRYDEPDLDYYLSEFEAYIDYGDYQEKDKPLLYKSESEPHTTYNFTCNELKQTLKQLDWYGYKVLFEANISSKEVNEDNKEKQEKFQGELKRELRDILFKILVYEQKKNPDKQLFTKSLKDIDYDVIKIGRNSPQFLDVLKRINYPRAYRFIYEHFKIVKELFSNVAFTFSPISIVTTKKLFLRSNLLLKGYNHLYDGIEKGTDPIFIMDESVETKDTLNEIIAENSHNSSDLLYVAEPLNNLIANDDISTGIVGVDKKETIDVVKAATKFLREIFKRYNLDKKIFADESVILDQAQKQAMFASISQNITTSNRIRVEDEEGNTEYVPVLWIDTREAESHNHLILRNIRFYDFENDKFTKKRQNPKKIMAQSAELMSKFKEEDYIIYPLDEMFQSLSTATEFTIRKISRAGFGSRYTELEKLIPKIDYDDNYNLFRQLIRSGLKPSTYEFYDKTIRNNLNVSKYRTQTNAFENWGLSIFNLRILDTREVVIDYSHANNTAERLWYDFTSKFKVFGIDALGDLRDDPKNFSSVYLKSHLRNHFMIAKNSNMAQAIKAKLDYEKEKLNVSVIKPKIIKPNLILTLDNIFKTDDSQTRFLKFYLHLDAQTKKSLGAALSFLLYKDDNEKYSETERVNQLESDMVNSQFDWISNIQHYYMRRWLKRINALLRILDLFNEKPEYRSALLFLNTKLSKKELTSLCEIAAIYSNYKGYNFNENWLDAWSADAFKTGIYQQLPEYKQVLQKELGAGKHKIIFSTYATMAKGQNVNYPIPEDESIKQHLKFLGVGSDKQDVTKDWDCGYFEQPTQLITKYDYNKPETLFEAIFDLKALQFIGAVDKREVNRIIGNLLRGEEAVFSQYNRPAIHLVITALMGQALGRFNRTNQRLDQTIILDDDLYNKPFGTGRMTHYFNLCQFGYFTDPDRAFPYLTALENAVYDAINKSDDIDFESMLESERERLLAPDKVLQLNDAEKSQDELKKLIYKEDDPINKKEKWVAHKFAKAYMQANHSLNNKEFMRHDNFLADMSHLGNSNVDRYIADDLKYSLLKYGGKYQGNQYWVITDQGGKKATDVKFDEEFDRNQVKMQKHIDLTNESKLAHLLSIPRFIDYLNTKFSRVRDLLTKEEIRILINGRADSKKINKELISERSQRLSPFLNQKIDWNNYLKAGNYLPTLAYYEEMIGYLGELAAQYILANFKELAHTEPAINLVDYDTPDFMNGILEPFTEVADFAYVDSTLDNLTLFDIKQWSSSEKPRELYLNKGRINKINLIASLDSVKHVNYVFINVLKMEQSHDLEIVGPYPVDDLDNVSFYEVPMLYDYQNNTFIENKGYQYQLSELLRKIRENSIN